MLSEILKSQNHHSLNKVVTANFYARFKYKSLKKNLFHFLAKNVKNRPKKSNFLNFLSEKIQNGPKRILDENFETFSPHDFFLLKNWELGSSVEKRQRTKNHFFEIAKCLAFKWSIKFCLPTKSIFGRITRGFRKK